MAYISIHIGQAGAQIGETCWKLYCLEHGLQPDGQRSIRRSDLEGRDNTDVLFGEASAGNLYARAIFVDLDPTTIDKIRKSDYAQIFHPDQLISGKEDAASLYARAYYNLGKHIYPVVRDRIRKLTESCDRVKGVLLFHSVSGGTGSGVTSLVLEDILSDSELSRKRPTCQFSLYPSPRLSSETIEPYNAVLHTPAAIDHANITCMFENEALYHILNKMEVDCLLFKNMNELVSHAVSSVSAPSRFPGSNSVSLSDITMNLAPYPRQHFVKPSYAPFLPSGSTPFFDSSVQEITSSCFSSSNQMTVHDPTVGNHLACCLLYKGNMTINQVHSAVTDTIAKRRLQLARWTPNIFKVGISRRPPTSDQDGLLGVVDRSVCGLSNTTAITQTWDRLCFKFDLMMGKRAFVHWYVGEGMEMEQFQEARERVEYLKTDYQLLQEH